jgi:hypothetical protein
VWKPSHGIQLPSDDVSLRRQESRDAVRAFMRSMPLGDGMSVKITAELKKTVVQRPATAADSIRVLERTTPPGGRHSTKTSSMATRAVPRQACKVEFDTVTNVYF